VVTAETPLAVALRAALTREWQSTQALRDAVSTRSHRPALSDVAATLRQLRRDGVCERASRGTDGHAWRRA
jgi:hypothetical protein